MMTHISENPDKRGCSIDSAELLKFLRKTAAEIESNHKQLTADGKVEDARVDESIALYLRECLIEEISAEFSLED